MAVPEEGKVSFMGDVLIGVPQFFWPKISSGEVRSAVGADSPPPPIKGSRLHNDPFLSVAEYLCGTVLRDTNAFCDLCRKAIDPKP